MKSLSKLFALLFVLLIMLVVASPAEAKFFKGGFLGKFKRQTGTTTAAPVPSTPPVPAKADLKVEFKATPIKAGDVVLTPCEEKLLDGLNALRIKRGMPPCSVSADLMKRCRTHAQAMASRLSMYHSPYGPETVAMNATDAVGATNQWYKSPPHYGIMTNPYLRYVGLSGYRVGNRSYYVQQFTR